jgi:hypothetical protein
LPSPSIENQELDRAQSRCVHPCAGRMAPSRPRSIVSELHYQWPALWGHAFLFGRPGSSGFTLAENRNRSSILALSHFQTETPDSTPRSGRGGLFLKML